MQYHQQIGPIPLPIAGPSTQQLDDLMSLPGTNDLQASETQQQIIRSVTPNNNDTTGQTSDSTEPADNSTANTGQDFILHAANQNRSSIGNEEHPSSYTYLP
ncbi:hypothetical protein WA026_023764 [Henosepilachna vigintioctopunctata]|uniref:Uncharacterized protein n=1 Tax=Henosepilachna vigintioctopunctata TaxID=420089 RepID=A0AAW1USY6_9CUCU